MGRPPLAVGTYGQVKTNRDGEGWRSRAYVRDPDGRRREVSRWRDTRAGAERALRDALKVREHAGASDELGPESRFGVVLDAYLADVLKSSKAANTVRLYRLAVENHVRPALGELRLRELTVPRVDAALRAITAASGTGTGKTARSVLGSAVGMAVRLGAMPSNPVRDASPTSRVTSKEVRSLTIDEQWRVMDAPRASERAVALDLPDLIDWMLGTGMRIGEAIAIRDDVLDLDAGTVEVNATVVRITKREAADLGIPAGLYVQERPKSAAGWRVLALPVELVDMLRRRRGELRLDGPSKVLRLDKSGHAHESAIALAFPSPTGKLRDPSNTSADLRVVLDAIDCPDDEPVGPLGWVTSHVFRKTAATRLDDAGMSARQIADVLGHEKPSMTQDVYMGRKVVSAEAALILARPAR